VLLDEMFGTTAEMRLRTRLSPAGLTVLRGAAVQFSERDSAVIAFAAAQRLTLATRNVQDFLRLNEQWTVLRDWALLARPHAGILIALGPVHERDWADLIADLLLHPRCPALEDQVLLWRAAGGFWESDHPYSNRRRQTVHL
jgi:hypothetical protein